jgi:hypothetical protein
MLQIPLVYATRQQQAWDHQQQPAKQARRILQSRLLSSKHPLLEFCPCFAQVTSCATHALSCQALSEEFLRQARSVASALVNALLTFWGHSHLTRYMIARVLRVAASPFNHPATAAGQPPPAHIYTKPTYLAYTKPTLIHVSLIKWYHM